MDPDQPYRDDELAALLDRLRTEHHVVGAQLAIDDGRAGVVHEAASGVLNVELGTPVTSDSLFQIGSITKVYTSTLVMQLVDEGRLDLDVPVAHYLSDFVLADADQSRQVTTRDLLRHTSGIEGDIFWDTGRGDDCVRRYVERLSEVGFVHPVGSTASYCNSGFVVAGRIVEELTEQTWDEALAERVLGPLEVTHTQTLAERMIRYAVAHGHEVDDGGTASLVPRWDIPRSSGPAGSIAAHARDVCAFARLHLDLGTGPSGTSIISSQSVRAMQNEEAAAPAFGRRGLGWSLPDWSVPACGHNGGTYGQLAFLRVVPGSDLALVLLTNGGDGTAMFEELARSVLGRCGVQLPEPLTPPEQPPAGLALGLFAGTFSRYGTTMRLAPDGDVLSAELTHEEGFSSEETGTTERIIFHPVDEHTLLAQFKGKTWMEARRYWPDGSGVEYLHYAGRVARRTA